jgi:predicted Zn-ribbon and HTH transcriptional regulator
MDKRKTEDWLIITRPKPITTVICNDCGCEYNQLLDKCPCCKSVNKETKE